MRIDLNCPFSEKDKAKRLGARWDAKRKIWYVDNVPDLAPFAAWMPAAQGGPGNDALRPGARAPSARGAAAAAASPGIGTAVTRNLASVPHCGCDALPWEDCVHTPASDGDAVP